MRFPFFFPYFSFSWISPLHLSSPLFTPVPPSPHHTHHSPSQLKPHYGYLIIHNPFPFPPPSPRQISTSHFVCEKKSSSRLSFLPRRERERQNPRIWMNSHPIFYSSIFPYSKKGKKGGVGFFSKTL